MIGFVVEAPLAEDNICTGVLYSLDHIGEVGLLHLLELFVLLSILNLEPVLGLRLRRLEGAGKDDDLGVINLFVHLGVREVLVNNDALNELRVLDSSTSLGDDLDEIKVDILPLEVGDMEHGLDSKLCEVVLTLAYNLGSEGRRGALL